MRSGVGDKPDLNLNLKNVDPDEVMIETCKDLPIQQPKDFLWLAMKMPRNDLDPPVEIEQTLMIHITIPTEVQIILMKYFLPFLNC